MMGDGVGGLGGEQPLPPPCPVPPPTPPRRVDEEPDEGEVESWGTGGRAEKENESERRVGTRGCDEDGTGMACERAGGAAAVDIKNREAEEGEAAKKSEGWSGGTGSRGAWRR